MAAAGVHACPDCGREAEVEEDREPLILEGRRGEIEYTGTAVLLLPLSAGFFSL